MLRSATFTIGILLAGLAFVGFLVLGGLMAPAPYSVVVAVQNIPAYSTLDPNAFGVDAQRVNGQVARTLVLREEMDQYAGGFVLENIQAGEPLRKSAIVAPGNPQAIDRLALAMTDPDKVALVIPMDAKNAPAQIVAGDWVDVVVGLAPGNISAGSNSTFSSLLLPPTPASPILPFGPSPTGTSRSFAIPTSTAPQASPATSVGNVGANEMNLPADKVVIQNVSVLAVHFQQVPNPAFTGSGAGFGQTQPSQSAAPSAYIQGDIQSVTVLVPRSSVELLTFGIDNGRVHLILLPAKSAQAATGAQSPTFGITFNDVLAWMMRERSLIASGQTQSLPTPSPQAAATLPSPTPGPGATEPSSPAGTQPSARATRAPVSQSSPPPTAPAALTTGLDLGALVAPLLCGVLLLVLFVAAVRFVRQRRRDSGIV